MIHITKAEIIHNGDQSTGEMVEVGVTIHQDDLEKFREQFRQMYNLTNEHLINFIYHETQKRGRP